MKDMKPVAWIVSDGSSQFITTKEDELKNAIRFNWTVTPLYAIPEGFVVVPAESIAQAVEAGFMASGEGYNGEHCGRLSSEGQAREIADAYVKAKFKAA